jgi:hypothetical protein
LFAGAALAAVPDRTVHGTTVVSHHDPAVTVTLPATAHYVGADRFVLMDPKMGPFDDCELHAFVEPGDRGIVRKLYWVQFEAYLPRVPNVHHAYDSPRHVTLGGFDFYVDTWVSSGSAPPEPGSDTEHLDGVLKAHGYSRGDMMTVRLVHLPDAAKRTELMVIYSEALPPGQTAASLKKGGPAYARWPGMEKGLIERATQAVRIQPH